MSSDGQNCTLGMERLFCWNAFVHVAVRLLIDIVLLSLSVSINNKLQQPQAAHGVLVYAMKNHGADVVSYY